jgi:hypothetical protein
VSVTTAPLFSPIITLIALGVFGWRREGPSPGLLSAPLLSTVIERAVINARPLDESSP